MIGAILDAGRSILITLGIILLIVMVGVFLGAQPRQSTAQAATPAPSPTIVPEPTLPGLPTPRNVGAPDRVGWTGRTYEESNALKEWRLEDGVRCYWISGPQLACVVVPPSPTRGAQ